MNDKEIIYNIIGRYIDNIIGYAHNPLLNILSEPIKNYVFRYLSPYLDAFMDNNKFELDSASAFLEDEALKRIENFKKTFKEKKNEDI